jgi:voltage-gated potassium channel
MSETTTSLSLGMRLEAVRSTVRFYLDDIQTPIGVAVDLFITQLVLTSVGIFVAQTYPLPEPIHTALDVINTGILWLFVAEYCLRLWCAADRLRFIFSLYSVIDLMAILPFLMGFVDVGFIRVFRWFRILRLARFLENQAILGGVWTRDTPALVRILFTLFAIIFVYSGLIYQVEHLANSQSFKTFLDAFYFSVVTMTTVGFGDVTPVTEAGRLLTVLMILTGVVLIPWQVGDLVRRLVTPPSQIEMLCEGCKLDIHDVDAQFCKQCGTPLTGASCRL